MKRLLKQKNKEMPKHVVANLFWVKKQGKKSFEKRLLSAEELINLQVEKRIPILTINLLSKNFIPEHVDSLMDFFSRLKQNKVIKRNAVKVSVLGKWYDLPSRVYEHIRNVVDDTKGYDRYFLNFCINYSPKEEIADVAKILARKIEANKLIMEDIDESEIKSNIYSSYFLPVDLIIEAGNKFMGTLLFDSVGAKIYFLGKKQLTRNEFLKAIKKWQKN